jgi:hypothetical protein
MAMDRTVFRELMQEVTAKAHAGADLDHNPQHTGPRMTARSLPFIVCR